MMLGRSDTFQTTAITSTRHINNTGSFQLTHPCIGRDLGTQSGGEPWRACVGLRVRGSPARNRTERILRDDFFLSRSFLHPSASSVLLSFLLQSASASTLPHVSQVLRFDPPLSLVPSSYDNDTPHVEHDQLVPLESNLSEGSSPPR